MLRSEEQRYYSSCPLSLSLNTAPADARVLMQVHKRWGEFGPDEHMQLAKLVYDMLSEVGGAAEPEPWVIKSKARQPQPTNCDWSRHCT